jgi:hypothetical protein
MVKETNTVLVMMHRICRRTSILVIEKTERENITVYIVQAIKLRHKNEGEEQIKQHGEITLL